MMSRNERLDIKFHSTAAGRRHRHLRKLMLKEEIDINYDLKLEDHHEHVSDAVA